MISHIAAQNAPVRLGCSSSVARDAAARGAAARDGVARDAAARDAAAGAAPAAPGAGDFESQCLPYRRELLAVALQMTRVEADAHDLVQETLMRAYVAWPRFELGTNCRAWLYRILTNSFINIYRKRVRHRRFAVERRDDTVAAIYGDSADHVSDAADELIGEALGDEVTAALSTLADEYRQVVELADLHGQRYRDIADALGVPIGTVMSRLFRARRQLEKQLSTFAASDYGIRRAA